VRVIAVLLIAVLAGACAGPTSSAAPFVAERQSPTPQREPTVVPQPIPEPSASPTVAPIPAPSRSAQAGDPLLITCDSPPFAVEIFDRPPIDELEDHPSAAVLRGVLAQGFPMEAAPSGWWRVARDASSATYLQGSGPVYLYYLIEAGPRGWAWNGRTGECTLTPDLQGQNPVTWTLDPSAPAPMATSTALNLLVTEQRCASGRPVAGRLLAPAIVYEPAAVFITFAAVPQPGDGQDCQANGPEKVTVKLREPLGDRTLRGWDPPPASGG
jgi:hypothetical protein